jgi:hypothetical protein
MLPSVRSFPKFFVVIKIKIIYGRPIYGTIVMDSRFILKNMLIALKF